MPGRLSCVVFEGDDVADAPRVALRWVQVFAGRAELGKVVLQLSEFTNAGGDLCSPLLQQADHVSTWGTAAVANPQDLANVGQG